MSDQTFFIWKCPACPHSYDDYHPARQPPSCAGNLPSGDKHPATVMQRIEVAPVDDQDWEAAWRGADDRARWQRNRANEAEAKLAQVTKYRDDLWDSAEALQSRFDKLVAAAERHRDGTDEDAGTVDWDFYRVLHEVTASSEAAPEVEHVGPRGPVVTQHTRSSTAASEGAQPPEPQSEADSYARLDERTVSMLLAAKDKRIARLTEELDDQAKGPGWSTHTYVISREHQESLAVKDTEIEGLKCQIDDLHGVLWAKDTQIVELTEELDDQAEGWTQCNEDCKEVEAEVEVKDKRIEKLEDALRPFSQYLCRMEDIQRARQALNPTKEPTHPWSEMEKEAVENIVEASVKETALSAPENEAVPTGPTVVDSGAESADQETALNEGQDDQLANGGYKQLQGVAESVVGGTGLRKAARPSLSADKELCGPGCIGCEKCCPSRAESADDDYDIALRPDSQGQLDDVVVNGVESFRAERLSDELFWLCCNLANGERITWHATAPRKGRVELATGEYPENVRYEHGSMDEEAALEGGESVDREATGMGGDAVTPSSTPIGDSPPSSAAKSELFDGFHTEVRLTIRQLVEARHKELVQESYDAGYRRGSCGG